MNKKLKKVFDHEENNNAGSGLVLGISLGIVYGIVFSNIAIGIAIGVGFGIIFSSALKEKKVEKDKI
jgi:uncharacterized membrane protein